MALSVFGGFFKNKIVVLASQLTDSAVSET